MATMCIACLKRSREAITIITSITIITIMTCIITMIAIITCIITMISDRRSSRPSWKALCSADPLCWESSYIITIIHIILYHIMHIIHVYIYIYIHIEREVCREREREIYLYIYLYISLSIYIYIYTHTYIHTHVVYIIIRLVTTVTFKREPSEATLCIETVALLASREGGAVFRVSLSQKLTRSLRNGYHISGRQQDRKLTSPDTGRQ